MSLTAAMTLRRGPLLVDLRLQVAAGETTALVGPNAAGKSSCLAAIAGLLRIERGAIVCGERTLDGGPGGAWLPPEARGVGMVFQDRLLFPHLSALDNVAYGPRSRGVPRRQARAAAAAWLERFGLDGCGNRRPATLSGGQAQRVALARALAAAPELLLLDEPLAAVDASARLALRRELRTHLAGFAGPRLVVLHDIVDAAALADRVIVIEAGRLVQAGTIAEIVGRPRSRFAAELVGLNCFAGSCHRGVVAVGDARLTVASAAEGEVFATVHPRAVALFGDRPAGSPRNVWSAPIIAIEPSLERVRVQVGGELPVVAEVTPAAIAELGLRAGMQVWVAIKATEIGVAPR